MSDEKMVSDMTDNKTTIERLEKELKEQRVSTDRMWSYWKEEEMKTKILLTFIKAGIDTNAYMSAGELIEKIIKSL